MSAPLSLSTVESVWQAAEAVFGPHTAAVVVCDRPGVGLAATSGHVSLNQGRAMAAACSTSGDYTSTHLVTPGRGESYEIRTY